MRYKTLLDFLNISPRFSRYAATRNITSIEDNRAWINHWEIDENVALKNINNIKNIATSKFKEKMWCEKYLDLKEN